MAGSSPTPFVAYANEFHSCMPLERAEELYTAVMADTRLTRAERDKLVWLAYHRFWADPRDAGNAFAMWLVAQALDTEAP